MADLLYRVQVSHQRSSGLPEDVVTNTFHFDGDDSGSSWDAGATDIVSRLDTFYTQINNLLSDLITGTSVVKLTDPRDPEPQLPRRTETITFPTNSTSALPAEVALCLSFKATTASGENPRRRRGRVYLGPFAETILGSKTAGDIRPLQAAVDTIVSAAGAMILGGVGMPRLSIFSPTTAAIVANIEDAFNDVETYWVDDAFDTVRSRGAAPLIRTSGTVSG